MKRIISLLLCCVFVLITTGCDTASSAFEITVVLDWLPNTNHTGIYVAQELGYFAEEGLTVTIQSSPEDGATPLVAAGTADFGIDAQDALASAFAREDPLPITAVAALEQHNTSGLLSPTSCDITRPADLCDHRYAYSGRPTEEEILKSLVEGDGGDFSQVEQIPSTVTDISNAFAPGGVDCIWVFYGWDGIAAQQMGINCNYLPIRDYNPAFDYYTPVLIANNEFLEQHPEETKRFLNACQRGYQYAAEYPEEAAAILQKATPETDSTLLLESQRYMSAQYQEDSIPWGYMDPDRWNAFYQWLWENQVIDYPIPEHFGMTNGYLP